MYIYKYKIKSKRNIKITNKRGRSFISDAKDSRTVFTCLNKL